MDRLTPRSVLFLLAAVLGATVGLYFTVTQQPDGGVDFFARRSYYIILALVLGWAFAGGVLWRATGWSLITSLRENRAGVAVALGFVTVCALSVPMEFKTLSDETNLLSVSQSMLNDRTVFNTTLAKNFYGNLNPAFVSVPTRPLVQPFFVHLLHQFTGYRYQNAFYLNLIAYFFVLVLVYGLGRRMGGSTLGIAAQALLASYPIYSISATSGGFDLLSILFFLILFQTLWSFFSDAKPERFVFLWLTAFVFANIRYESVVYLPLLVVAILAARKWSTKLTQRAGWVVAVSPVFLLPFVLQRKLTPNSHENPPGVEPFSFDHLWNHLITLLDSQWNIRDVFLPYAPLLNWFLPVAFAAVAYVWIQGAMGSWTRERKIWLVTLGVGFVLSMGIYLSHHLGVYTHPTQARFFLLFSLFGAMSPVVLSAAFPRFVTPGRVLALGIFTFLMYHPIAVQNRFINSLTLNRETRQIISFLEKNGNPNVIVVSDRPGQYSSMGYGSVDFPFLARNADGFLLELRRRLFQDIFLMQKINYSDGAPYPEHRLDESKFKLETLYETQVDAGVLLRISRVVR